MLGAVVLKGYTDVIKGDLPAGMGGAVRRRHDRVAGSGPARDHLAARLRAAHNYTVFVVYRLIASAVILLLITTGVRDATF